MSKEITAKGYKTRNHIIDTAMSLFKEHGFDTVTVAQICKQANISNGSFFHYFPEKIDVLYEYVRDESHDLEAYAATLDDRNAKEALLKINEWQANNYEEKGCDFIAHFHSHLIVSRKTENFVYSFTPIAAQIIERGQKEGLFRKEPEPAFVAELLFSEIVSIATYKRWPKKEEHESMKDMLLIMYQKFYNQILRA